MPVPASPTPPAEQVALRAMLERLLAEYQDVATYEHGDKFDESRQAAVYGWGTEIIPHGVGQSITIWFDGLDHDIAVWTDSTGWRRKHRGLWFEWLDLTDIDAVLAAVEERLRNLLATFE